MTYSIKEIFYTLQGEGANAGRAAVFCRFTGCNLWSGRERDRPNAACRFCDTDFVGIDGTFGGKFKDADQLALTIDSQWPFFTPGKFVVLTGGEPLLQVDAALVKSLHRLGFEIAVETNGTVQPPPGIDWLCVSPKARAPLVVKSGSELKVVVPQDDMNMGALESLDFGHRFVQPMDGPDRVANTKWAIDWCMQNPAWRLSVQSHKVIGIR